jgi:hypothetical protein
VAETSFVISNIVTCFLPLKTALSVSSALMLVFFFSLEPKDDRPADEADARAGGKRTWIVDQHGGAALELCPHVAFSGDEKVTPFLGLDF